MSYLSYVHKNFGVITMRIHNWELGAILNHIARANRDGEVISHVSVKGI